MDFTRFSCPAKPAQAGLEIKRGTKVMIVQMKDHLALVEPITDPLLLQSLEDKQL
jgi:hypothetical protein